MSRKALLVLGVLLAGVAVACWVVFVLLGLNPAYEDTLATLAVLAAVIGGLPALLATFRTRVAFIILVGVAILLGIWGGSLMSSSGEDALYGYIVLLADIILLTYGLAVIGLRALIIKNHKA
ncbi:hypothetical protein C0V72_12355 [Porphyrobacter sp. TH134]|uniref:hypothetical protein n=1 Tax=Porphyrobacter sp. TH134 TaxID=2067450 RepID=UPI000C7DD47B|nr:hypothetical protein [Porphyrobacter sp. TH134]PLK22914.1 hypothetical protein C0V72_12355 [Porphyrobacter sp. TH134]